MTSRRPRPPAWQGDRDPLRRDARRSDMATPLCRFVGCGDLSYLSFFSLSCVHQTTIPSYVSPALNFDAGFGWAVTYISARAPCCALPVTAVARATGTQDGRVATFTRVASRN